MILHVLFGQRKESYPGEYAPEALAVMTEYDHDENPAWMTAQHEKQTSEKHWEVVRIVQLQVSIDSLMQVIRPDRKIAAQVRGETIL